MEFREKRGIAYCGMACVLCRLEGHDDCPGCAAEYNKKADDCCVIQCAERKGVDGCFACSNYPCGNENNDCFVKQCVRKKGIEGCFTCPDYPCGNDWGLFQSKRNKAFLRYAREFGKQALIDRLRVNYENGITYQEPGKSGGDYDVLETEYEIYQLLRYGHEERAETNKNIEITIKPLSPELMADYFDFFNNRAFTDNPPWGGCYCTNFQMTKEEIKTELYDQMEAYGGGQKNFMRVLREIVVRQITSRALRGYLAYVDGMSIGWCNANDRANFPVESADGSRLYAPTEKREKVVICFEIAPEYRGKGVATALLNRVVTDAKAEGYAAVEGFPRRHEVGGRSEWDYTGPTRLYEKLGFTAITKQDGSVIMRKELED